MLAGVLVAAAVAVPDSPFVSNAGDYGRDPKQRGPSSYLCFYSDARPCYDVQTYVYPSTVVAAAAGEALFAQADYFEASSSCSIFCGYSASSCGEERVAIAVVQSLTRRGARKTLVLKWTGDCI